MMRSIADIFGPNTGYVLELYEQYINDPESVDPELRTWFAQNAQLLEHDSTASIPQQQPSTQNVDNMHAIAAARLVRTIREVGHLAASIDPLGKKPIGDPSLDLEYHGLTPQILQQLPATILRSPLETECQNAYEAVMKLRSLYSGTVGYEPDHIQVYEERKWFHDAIETRRFY
ncbi:MAG: 2-oxoglutarate dehydrogenase E1 subunit family protein, partial [Roseiflexaceae bacterium]